MFTNQELIDMLPVAEVISAVEDMVRHYDRTGKYYDTNTNNHDFWNSSKYLVEKYFSLSPDFYDILEKIAKENYERLHVSCFDDEKEDYSSEKARIFDSICDYLVSEARKISENREQLRIPVGCSVDFKECVYAYKYLNKTEFYKDGGWGIAEEDGTVIVKNHLLKQPSNIYPLIENAKCPYCIIQDRDTKKFGVLSRLTFHEAIHCQYDKIEVIKYFKAQTIHFILKVLKNERIGCFDENCALLVECKYDDIVLNNGYLECIRDGNYLIYDTLGKNSFDSILEGKKDLYDVEGTLLLGGYDHLEVETDIFKFYFGTTYKDYYVEETDIYDQPYKLSKLRLDYQNSLCLVLDKNFKTIIKNKNGYYQLRKGRIINSKEELIGIVPSAFLFKYKVDLSELTDGFIYLHDDNAEQYLIPRYIIEDLNSPEELDELRNREFELDRLLSPSDSSDLPPALLYDDFADVYNEDSIVTIIKLSNDNEVDWVEYVNEINTIFYTTRIFRKGRKYGLYDIDGLKPALYDAVTRNTPDGKMYVALLERCQDKIMQASTNPNYSRRANRYIRYYRLGEDGTLTRIEDDWETFNPAKCDWCPSEFLDLYCDYSGESYGGRYENDGHEWTDEDAWDAMTDGMYGDYPGPGWDPESFGY